MTTSRLKFRAWDDENLCWVRPKLIENESGVIVDERGFDLAQWTGMTDSECVEIYSGDVIDFTWWWFDGSEQETHLRGQVVYSPDNMSFQLKGVINKEWERHTGYNGDEQYLTPFSELNFDDADFCVLGNVYESPELMERANG